MSIKNAEQYRTAEGSLVRRRQEERLMEYGLAFESIYEDLGDLSRPEIRALVAMLLNDSHVQKTIHNAVLMHREGWLA